MFLMPGVFILYLGITFGIINTTHLKLNIMKFVKINIHTCLFLCLALTSCSSQKSLQTDVPFELGDATVQQWLGGKEESGTGYLVTVPVSFVTKEVRFQEMYFRGQTALVTTEKNGDGLIVKANFATASKKQDLVMHADPKKEVGNQPPVVQKDSNKDFPFDLGPQEAVLSYIDKNRVKYVKLSELKEKSPLIYSTKPKN